ncbi:MAG TPA: TlpA disulfide reductase family protein [Terriglobia bacterium]|nr:TlpA disulfide reductase family protein [Terriglobia bacterium]
MSKKSTLKTGDHAPPLDLPGTDGAAHSLEQSLAQGPVLLAFFKVGCPTCQFAFPFLDRLHRQFKDHGAAVWGVSQDDSSSSLQFAAQYGVSFPVLIDAKPYEVSAQYGVAYTPTLFLVGRGGKVELTGEGFSKQDLLDTQKELARELSVTPAGLFLPNERVPEFKPG